MIFDVEKWLWKSDFDDPCESQWKSNEKINCVLLIFLQKSTPIPVDTCPEKSTSKTRTATDMDGTLHTDLWKSETTSREVKKSF